MTFSGPRLLLQLEGLVVLVAACLLYRMMGASWATFAWLFLAPDLTMVGYFFGLRVGAMSYNAGHTYTAPFLVWAVLALTQHSSLFSLCVIWVAHIGFDRLLGYGLKYDSNFKATHLNRV